MFQGSGFQLCDILEIAAVGAGAVVAPLFVLQSGHLFIVVHYLLVKTWFSLVFKTKKATQSLLTCLPVGYGQFAHAILSLWFILLAIPSWILAALIPPFLGGGAIAVIAATTSVLLASSSSMAPIDSSACYLDTGCTSIIMTNNSALLFGASPQWG